jgi:hypothetical protein
MEPQMAANGRNNCNRVNQVGTQAEVPKAVLLNSSAMLIV